MHAFITFVVVLIFPAVSGVCEELGWHQHLHWCYKFSQAIGTYRRAQLVCGYWASQPVAITDYEQQMFMELMRQIGNQYWIGLKRRSDLNWYWNNGVQLADFHPWKSHNPISNADHKCVHLSDWHEWSNELLCNQRIRFICQKAAPAEPDED